jgi:methionine synthase II (cobalamin-independent)
MHRTDVLGSLLRPSYLTNARAAFGAGDLTPAAFKRIEDRAVDQAIAMQEGAGLDVVTDGEMRRQTYFDEIFALEGVEKAPSIAIRFKGGAEFQLQAHVVDKVKRKTTRSIEEFTYARARARSIVKVTLPCPLHFATIWSPEASREAYPDVFDLLADGAEIIRDEARALAALGCEYIQIDAPDLVQVLADEESQKGWADLGVPLDRLLSDGLELINSVADVPNVTFGLHMCRGNFQSQWIAEGGYENVAEIAFPRTTNFDGFLLEYDDDRSGGFEPLKQLPDDKFVVLGLVSTKTDTVEDPASVATRIDEAAGFVCKDRLAISTQCGFASDASGNLLSASTQEAKLRLLADVAHEVWG